MNRFSNSKFFTARLVSSSAFTSFLFLLFGLIFYFGATHSIVLAQGGQELGRDDDGVVMNFPEQSDLKLLINSVSKTLDIKILYDEKVANKKITIRAPGKVPVENLLSLLESALKIKGLALVDADIPGWKQVVVSNDLAAIARPGDAAELEGLRGTVAVTQTFNLSHVQPEKIGNIIRPFLTEPGSNVITIPEQRLIIVTDYADNLAKINKLIETIDRAGPPNIVKSYIVEHVEAAGLAQQVSQTLIARTRNQGTTPNFSISADERTNQLILVGQESLIEDVGQLIKTLDVPLNVTTELYSFQYIAADRVDNLVRGLIDPIDLNRLYRSSIDSEDNILVVTAPPNVHQRIRVLANQMDVEGKRPGSSVKFYKLKNADAEQVIVTLNEIQRNGVTQQGVGQNAFPRDARGISQLGRGVSQAPFASGQFSLAQPLSTQGAPQTQTANGQGQGVQTNQQGSGSSQPLPPQNVGNQDAQANFVIPASARITADPFTNSIIVVGDRATQEIFDRLIEFLDKRRPQVMVECRVIVIDTSDNYALGVELSGGDRDGIERLFQFTSFGLSTVDPTSGALSLLPGVGLNASLIDPEDGDAVLRALASHSRARVLSVPRILVDDNSTGTLASVTEVPFTSINASNAVATTSFGGFAEAGTNIEVTPRISEDDHLSLDYAITVNTFTGTGADGVPPPRQTDEVRSTVTIPDGYTVIVGGLNSRNNANDIDGVPILEQIPLINRLTSSESASQSQTTLYVFLKPIILRDDKFEGLRFISQESLRCAGSCQDHPVSKPMLVR